MNEKDIAKIVDQLMEKWFGPKEAMVPLSERLSSLEEGLGYLEEKMGALENRQMLLNASFGAMARSFSMSQGSLERIPYGYVNKTNGYKRKLRRRVPQFY